jgi:hypothetical protein
MSASCLLDGCESPVKARGMCNTHYTRWRKHGDPLKVWRRGQRMTTADRFWSKVDRTAGPDGCWLWTRKRTKTGYGLFYVLRGSGFAAANAAKTHCPHGHEYTPENTYVNPNPDGGRICRTCKRQRDRLARARHRLDVDDPAAEGVA